jgi:hypothetical protein
MHNKASLTELFENEDSLPLVWVSQGGGPYSDDAPYRGEVFAHRSCGMVTVLDEPVVSWIQGIGSATLRNNYAKMVASRIYGAQIYRISLKDSPRAAWVSEWGGHDFAVVNARWLVDPALWHLGAGVVGNTEIGHIRVGSQFVFDLHDIDDCELVLQLYGDRRYWQPVNLPTMPEINL